MYLKEVRDILQAEVLCGEDMLDAEVWSACGSDFMSDVLAYVKNQALLLTGLVMKCIVFVRGKRPDASILELARDRQLVVMATKERMYPACGLLYTHGLHD